MAVVPLAVATNGLLGGGTGAAGTVAGLSVEVAMAQQIEVDAEVARQLIDVEMAVPRGITVDLDEAQQVEVEVQDDTIDTEVD
jgi:hypothetical protein